MSTRSDKPPDEKTPATPPPADPPAPAAAPPAAPPPAPAPAAPPPAAAKPPKPDAPPAPAPRAAKPQTVADVLQRPSTPAAQKEGVKAARKILKAAGIEVSKDEDVMAAAQAYASKQEERKAERKELKGRAAIADEAEATATEMIAVELAALTPEQQVTAKALFGDKKPVAQLKTLLDMKKAKMFGNAPAVPPAAIPPAGVTPPAPAPGAKPPVDPPARSAPTAPAPPAGGPTTPPDVKTEIDRIEQSAKEAVRRGQGHQGEAKRNTLIASVAKFANARKLYKDDNTEPQ